MRPGGALGAEVLLVRRAARASFMAESFVFPGGRLDPGETAVQAAVRELREETSIQLQPEALIPWAHWITPSAEPKRFSARFFLALAPQAHAAQVDEIETTEARWCAPAAAVAAHRAGELLLPPPTLHNLEQLCDHASLEELLAAARRWAGEVLPILPKLVLDGGDAVLLLPWDPDYAAAPGEAWRFPASHRLARARSRIVIPGGRWWGR
jgi:mutator protein MutT